MQLVYAGLPVTNLKVRLTDGQLNHTAYTTKDYCMRTTNYKALVYLRLTEIVPIKMTTTGSNPLILRSAYRRPGYDEIMLRPYNASQGYDPMIQVRYMF